MAGSETRQRQASIKVRCLPDEFAAIAAKSEAAGMSPAAYMRAAALGTAGPRAQRRLPVAAALLRQVLGHLGRVGSNLNQIARHLNEGRAAHTQLPELAEALADFTRMRDALYAALGKAPEEAPAKDAAPSRFIEPPRP